MLVALDSGRMIGRVTCPAMSLDDVYGERVALGGVADQEHAAGRPGDYRRAHCVRAAATSIVADRMNLTADPSVLRFIRYHRNPRQCKGSTRHAFPNAHLMGCILGTRVSHAAGPEPGGNCDGVCGLWWSNDDECPGVRVFLAVSRPTAAILSQRLLVQP
jgi:hypothetical protein